MLSGDNQLHASYRMGETGMDDKTSQFQSMKARDGGQDPCIWSSPGGGRKINLGKQIFCNRSLNMKNIVAVGFDMDYTLAQYKPETFESLAYGGTIRKLVYDLGYPSEVSLHFTHPAFLKFLIINGLKLFTSNTLIFFLHVIDFTCYL